MVNDVIGELESYQQYKFLLLCVNVFLWTDMLNKLFSHNNF